MPKRIGKLTVRSEPYPTYEGAPVNGGRLSLARGEDISNLAPTVVFAYTPFTMILDPLLFIDEFTLEVRPWLAERWEASADGTTYTMTLRDDVRWHDGTPLTADDVAFSYIGLRDDPESFVASYFLPLQPDPRAVDIRTVEFSLTEPTSFFLPITCNQFVFQRQQFADYWAATGSLSGYDFIANPLIGTGPWRPVRYQPDEGVLELERNPHYWVEPPHFEQLVFRNVQDANARLLAWKSREIDLLWPVTAADADAVKDDEEAWLYVSWAAADMEAWINFANPKQQVPGIFAPKLVRQALMHAIDRDGYAEAIFKGFVDQHAYGTVPFPWAYNPDVTHYAYDPERALTLLRDAGWTRDGDTLRNVAGQPFELSAMLYVLSTYPVDKIAESVQEDFRQIGIRMTIDRLEWAAYDERRKAGAFDLLFLGRVLWASFSDYNAYHSSYNIASNPNGYNYGWTSPEGDRLVDAIQRETNLLKQKELLHRLQELIADALPALWLGFPRDLILVRKNILGYQPNVMWQIWNTWSMWRAG